MLQTLKRPILPDIFSHLINLNAQKMVSKFHSSLSQDLSLILNDSDDCNVIIVVGNNQNIKEFRAHSYILRARSPYFKNAFLKASANRWINNNNVMKFNEPNINPPVFEIILRYVM
jgi:hypothetical protein